MADVVDVDDRPDTVAVVVGAAGEPELAERAAGIVDASPAAKAHQQLSAEAAGREQQRAADRAASDAGYEQTGRRRRWARRGVLVVVVLALLAIAGAFSLRWINDQYFVAVQDGTVAVFRGVNQQVGSIQMSKAVEVTDVDCRRASRDQPGQGGVGHQRRRSRRRREDHRTPAGRHRCLRRRRPAGRLPGRLARPERRDPAPTPRPRPSHRSADPGAHAGRHQPVPDPAPDPVTRP